MLTTRNAELEDGRQHVPSSHAHNHAPGQQDATPVQRASPEPDQLQEARYVGDVCALHMFGHVSVKTHSLDAYEEELQEPLASHPVAARLADITNRSWAAKPARSAKRGKRQRNKPPVPAGTRMGRMKPPTGPSPPVLKGTIGQDVQGCSVNTYLAHVFGGAT